MMADTAQRFRDFADIECRGSSLLYERLARGVAEDAELLALADKCAPGQPPPNLLFAAVHYLLLHAEMPSPLCAFYPDIAAAPAEPDGAFPAFKAFCRERHPEIAALLRTRLVQTNEVARSAVLLPALAQVWREGGLIPLAVVEVGASAGLNLLCDRYRYEYRFDSGEMYLAGPADAAVVIWCELRGLAPLLFPAAAPPVAWRVGLDLNPFDVRDPDAVAWLRALIWPEHQERAQLLAAAVAAAKADPPRLLRGDAVALLPDVLASVPFDTTLCVFHSHTVNQFPTAARERLRDALADASRARPIWRISMEGVSGEASPVVTLLRYADGAEVQAVRLARYEPHGRWLDWLSPQTG